MIKLLILSFLGLFGELEDQKLSEIQDQIFEVLDTDLEKAHELAEDFYNLSVESDYQYGEAKSLYIMAYCDDNLNKLNKAVPEYLKALEHFSEIHTNEGARNLAEIYMNLGRIFRIHYKYEDAINFYERGLIVAKDYNDRSTTKRLLHNLYIAYKYKGDLVKAAEIQFEKLGMLEENEKGDEVKSYNQIGLINMELKEFEEARTYFNHILSIEKDKKKSRYRGKAFHNIADSYLQEGKFTLSKDYYQKALIEKINIGNTKDLFVTYLDLTDLYIQTRSYADAEVYALEGSKISSEVSKNVSNNKINHYLSQIYFATNQPEKAKTYFEKYVTQMESLYDQQKELASQGDQYKIELITSTYFAKIQEREKFNYYSVGVVGIVMFFILFLIYSRYKRVAAAKLLREHFSSISFNISNSSSIK